MHRSSALRIQYISATISASDQNELRTHSVRPRHQIIAAKQLDWKLEVDGTSPDGREIEKSPQEMSRSNAAEKEATRPAKNAK